MEPQDIQGSMTLNIAGQGTGMIVIRMSAHPSLTAVG